MGGGPAPTAAPDAAGQCTARAGAGTRPPRSPSGGVRWRAVEEDAALGDGLAVRADEGAAGVGVVLTDRVPRGHRQGVGAVLDALAGVGAGRGGLVALHPAAVLERGTGGLPLLVGPARGWTAGSPAGRCRRMPWVTRASQPVEPLTHERGDVPVARYSRSRVMACQSARCGLLGPVERRMAGVQRATGDEHASVAARGRWRRPRRSRGAPTVASPSTSRSEASVAARRASIQADGGAASQAAGTASCTSAGLKLKKVATTTSAGDRAHRAAREAK